MEAGRGEACDGVRGCCEGEVDQMWGGKNHDLHTCIHNIQTTVIAIHV